MKKTIKFLFIFTLLLSLSACSSKTDKEYALTFFDAFNETLNMNSGHMTGSFISNANRDSKIRFDLGMNQENNLELSCDVDLEAGANTNDNFINFYIKDGKTYLNASGVKSQSVVENIGLKKDQKLSIFNPFLDYTDKELQNFFRSASKKNNTYTFTLDPSSIAAYLDALGSIQIEEAILKTTIEEDVLKDFSLKINGYQTIQSEQVTIDIQIQCYFDQINTFNTINFPADLETY